MGKMLEYVREWFAAAQEALRQMQLAAPDYWDGALASAVRLGLAALALFACVLLAQLIVLLCARRREWKRIAAFAGTLVAVLALGVWAYRPLPVAPTGAQQIAVERVEANGAHRTLRLTAAQRQQLTVWLESAQCVRDVRAAVPETEETAYRVTYETTDGEASLWVARGVCLREASTENGLLYTVLSGDALYEALAAQ